LGLAKLLIEQLGFRNVYAFHGGQPGFLLVIQCPWAGHLENFHLPTKQVICNLKGGEGHVKSFFDEKDSLTTLFHTCDFLQHKRHIHTQHTERMNIMRKILGGFSMLFRLVVTGIVLVSLSFGQSYAQDRASIVTVDMTNAGHNSHYTAGEVIASLAPGGETMIISSGDAREIRTEWFSANAGGAGVPDGAWGTLYDIGGVEIGVSLPSGASTLEFDLQYVAHDYTPFEDPVRIYLNGGFVREFTIQSEFGGFPGGLNIGPVRHVVLNVSALSGTATIRFQASDRWDHILDGGAIIDNLTVGASGTPDITGVNPFGGHFQLDVQSEGYLPPGGGPTNAPPVALTKNIDVYLDANGNATITPSAVNNGSSDPDGDPITLSLDVSSFDCNDLGANWSYPAFVDNVGFSTKCICAINFS
jgi:hypothetical protein